MLETLLIGFGAVIVLFLATVALYAFVVAPVAYLYYDSEIERRAKYSVYGKYMEKVIVDDEPYSITRSIGHDMMAVYWCLTVLLAALAVVYVIGLAVQTLL